jgi:Bifunctional DNA primase/polymerase, N-terminal.
MADMLPAALWYAGRGWPVFPCVINGKEPRTAHGFKDATTDPAVITAWWARSPGANIAVATGAPGPDVLDVDTKDGRDGMQLFQRAREAGLLRGATAVINTPSGGIHVHFTGTNQPGGAVGGKAKPLELKAVGGYVLLPPSYVVDDKYGYQGRYELAEHREAGGTIDFAAVRRLLEPAPTMPPRRRFEGNGPMTQKRAQRLVDFVCGAPDGNRNRALYWAACRAAEAGAPTPVFDMLVDAAVVAGLFRSEGVRTVESAKRKVGWSA